MGITIKDEPGIQEMRTACRLAAEVLDHLTPFIKPGITTREIDRLAAEHMQKQGSISATLGYQPSGYPPYPASLCTSVRIGTFSSRRTLARISRPLSMPGPRKLAPEDRLALS